MQNRLSYIRFLVTGLILPLVLVGTGCVKDDFRVTTDMEGYPVTVSLNLGMGEASDIVVSRADNSNSDLINLVLFVYGSDGRFQQMLSTTASEQDNNRITIGSSSAAEDGVKYPITIKTTSGTKNLLAVANTSSVASEGGFWESMASIAKGAQDGTLDFEGLKAAVIELRKDLYEDSEMLPIQITASSQMLISGSNEGVVFNTSGNVTKYGQLDGTDKVVLKMDRAMARITFNIAEKPDKAKGIFTPSSFKVYNIPVESSLTNAAKSETSYETYINSASMNIGNISGGKYSFTFYMPENIQKVKQGTTIKSYNDRDTWTVDRGSLPENKTWTNAPQNSTFVVVSGTYSQTAADGAGNNYTGNVSYTIHLGDFSTGDNTTGSLDNFAVERNCAYTYNMSVLSVDRIVVEAKKEEGKEYQQGAEGQIFTYNATTYSYELDAHYEQVFLEYNLTTIADAVRSAIGKYDNTQTDEKIIDNAIADNMILVIQSEAMDYTHLATDEDPYYSVQNKRGTLKPYKIYSDSVRGVSEVTKDDILDGEGTDDKPTKGFDYKWIEFWPQSGTDIAAYPGVSSWSREDITGFKNKDVYGGAATAESKYLMDVYDVIVAMGNVVKKIYKEETVSTTERDEDGITITTLQNGNYVARFTAFVNEYYYYRHPLTGAKVDMWSVMTNKIPREMIIAMSSSVSDDGNSSYSQIYSYITQLSMQTFYNARTSTSINGFGIETYNETPRLTFGTPQSTNGLNKTAGRSNQITLIGGTEDTKWDTYINPSYNGWKTSVGNDHATHKLNSMAYKTTYGDGAYYACMSRNRDLNGNGKIDNNEVRWYLPSLNEYIRIGIGSNAISNAAQLYIGDKAQMKRRSDNNYTDGYPIDYIWDGALFYTSSGNEERVYWAAERGSYSADGINWGGGSKPKPIRCIRALPATIGDNDISTVHVESDASFVGHNLPNEPGYNENNPIVLEFRNRLIDDLYRERTDGALVPHNEDDAANSYYDGIIVAQDYLEDKYPLRTILNFGGTDNPCKDYHEDGATWRVPNLAELSAMNAVGLITEEKTACCTQFSNQNVRFGFGYNGAKIYCYGDDTNVENLNSHFPIRCVRDVPKGYVLPTN